MFNLPLNTKLSKVSEQSTNRENSPGIRKERSERSDVIGADVIPEDSAKENKSD